MWLTVLFTQTHAEAHKHVQPNQADIIFKKRAHQGISSAHSSRLLIALLIQLSSELSVVTSHEYHGLDNHSL